jgi:hypothetical protein
MHMTPTQSPSTRTAFHALPQSACPASTPACKEHVQTDTDTSTASLPFSRTHPTNMDTSICIHPHPHLHPRPSLFAFTTWLDADRHPRLLMSMSWLVSRLSRFAPQTPVLDDDDGDDGALDSASPPCPPCPPCPPPALAEPASVTRIRRRSCPCPPICA